MGFFNKIAEYLKKVSASSFTLSNNQLQFMIDKDKTLSYDLDEYDMKTRHDPYVLHSYTLKDQNIHLEYIHRDSNTHWNGYARGFYEVLLKEELKLKSLELLQKQEHKHFEFCTYRVNENFVIHLIYIWETHKDIFIIDTKGKLFTSLLSKIQPNFKDKYAQEEKGSVNFDISLVKKNAFNSYFNHSN